MSFRNTNAAYKRLNQQQRTFIQQQGTTCAMSIPRWIKFLEPICAFDELCDSVNEKLFNWTMGCFVGCFITVFIGMFVSAAFESILPMFVSIPFLAASIFLGFYYSYYKRRDTNNNVRNVILPFLHMLSLEVGLKKPVKLHVNFHKPLAKKDVVSKTNDGTFFRVNKAVFYQYEVVDLECNFLDGSRFSWKVIDRIRQRTRANARGKSKTKEKLIRRILLQISFARNLYVLSTPVADVSLSNGKIKETEQWIRCSSVIKQSAAGPTADMDTQQLIDTIKEPYQFLTIKETAHGTV